eukprot:2493235-Rhodomonas_salina.1
MSLWVSSLVSLTEREREGCRIIRVHGEPSTPLPSVLPDTCSFARVGMLIVTRKRSRIPTLTLLAILLTAFGALR